MDSMCTRRLRKELKSLAKDPIQDPRIVVSPNESNLLEMHYVIEGSKGTPYEGGVYHGKLIFPKEYPLKPPSVIMLTPSGRFQPNRRLCLSMSDFHPESWNPMWSVSTILTGLYSFMIESNPTLGSIETSTRKKRQLAAVSLKYNVENDKDFVKLFPDYVQRYQDEKLRQPAAPAETLAPHSSVSRENNLMAGPEPGMPQGLAATLAGIVAIMSVVIVYRFS